MNFNITFASPYFSDSYISDDTTISLTGNFDVPMDINYNDGDLNLSINGSGDANIISNKNLYIKPGSGYTTFLIGGDNPGETGGDIHLVPGSGTTKGAVKMYYYDSNDLYLAFSVGTGIGFLGN